MGIKLSKIIPRTYIEFEDLKNKKIAIDFSNTAYQFLASIRGSDGTPLMNSKGQVTSVYMGIFTRITNLMTKGIQPCFVFDGVPPDLKLGEQNNRKQKKVSAQDKLQLATQQDDMLAMKKYAKQTISLTPDIIQDAKLLLNALGLPVIQAPSESDAQISYLNKMGDVDYGASNDHDLLLFGCKTAVSTKLLTCL